MPPSLVAAHPEAASRVRAAAPAPRVEATIASELLLARGLAVVGLAGVGLVHVLDSVETFHETRYVFWLYMALVAGSIVVAAAVLGGRSVWPLVALIALAPLVGYVLSRTVGLPGTDGDDKGAWTDPLGLASLWIEGGLLVLAGYGAALSRRRTR